MSLPSKTKQKESNAGKRTMNPSVKRYNETIVASSSYEQSPPLSYHPRLRLHLPPLQMTNSIYALSICIWEYDALRFVRWGFAFG